MVVVKLWGDEWKLEEKIVVAFKPQQTFASQLALLINKLGTDDFNGLCLYKTEGRPPNFNRPTTPVSLNSTPQREKLMDGVVMYIKAADLETQERDRQTQAELDQWRKENGYTKGVEPDGADVKKFMEMLANNLNRADAKEINDSEELFRSKIEVEEFRGFRDITFELRDVMQMKEEAEKAIADAFDEWLVEATKMHYELILIPAFDDERVQFIKAETAARDGEEDEENFERAEILSREEQNRERLEEIQRKKDEEERRRREEEERKRREEEEKLRREEEERQRRLRMEEDARRRAEQETKLKELELLAQIGKQRERFAAPETVKQIVDDTVAESSKKLQEMVRDEVNKVTNELREYVYDNMNESKRRLDELLAYLLPYHNSAIAASFGAQLTHNAALINLYDEHVKDLGKQIEQRVQQTHLALEAKKKSEEAAEEQCRMLIEEQKLLIEEFANAEEVEKQEEKEDKENLETERTNAIDNLFNSILSSRTILDAIALEHQRNHIMKETKIAATNSHYRHLMEERNAALLLQQQKQPNMIDENGNYTFSARLFASSQFPLDKEPDVPVLDVDVHSIVSVFAERHGISAEEVADLIDRFDSDAWQIAEELVFMTDLTTSSQYEFARGYIEQHAAHLRPVIDLLLDVYKGREVEVIAAIVSSSKAIDGKNFDITNKPSDYVEGKEGQESSSNGEEERAPLARTFYYHKGLNRSQWLCPRCWEQPEGEEEEEL